MAGATAGGSPRPAAPPPRRTGAASSAFRVLLALTLICGASLLALSDGLVRGGASGRWPAAAVGLSRSLLDDYVLPWLSNRERLLVAVTGCEDHAALVRLLAALPPDPDVDVVCMLSEDALGDDANATAVADAHDVRVVAVHSGGWAAAWGAALRLLRDEGGEHLLTVQSDVLLPPRSLTALRAALRARPDVDILLPVVATSHALGLVDGVRLPAGLGLLTGGSGGPPPQYPEWIAAALDAVAAAGPGTGSAPAAAAPALRPPHPLRSYQLLMRVHPWLPEALRTNVSSQAATVQAALLAVNLPGSTLVPPPVVELPRAAAGAGGGGGASGGYAFSEPLSVAVGRGFLQRHADALAAAGVLTDVPHSDMHAADEVAVEEAEADDGGGEGAESGGSDTIVTAEDGSAESAAAAGGRRLQTAAGANAPAPAAADATAGRSGGGVDVALLQRRLSEAASFGVATRSLLVHVPSQPTGGSAGFEAAAVVPATDAGRAGGGGSVAVAAGADAASAAPAAPSAPSGRRRRRVIGVPWTGPDLPSGRGDQRVIAVFHRGQLLRRVRGKGRGRGRAFKARWSTESSEPLPAAWAELTAGMEETPIVVDVDLLPLLPPGVPTPGGLAGVATSGAAASAAGDSSSGGLGHSRHAPQRAGAGDGPDGGRRRRRRGRQQGGTGTAAAAAAAAAAVTDAAAAAGAERRQHRQQQGNGTTAAVGAAAAPAVAPSLPPLTPPPPPKAAAGAPQAPAAPAAVAPPPPSQAPPPGRGDKKDGAGGSGASGKGGHASSKEKKESRGGGDGGGSKAAAPAPVALAPAVQQQRPASTNTTSSSERGAPPTAADSGSKTGGTKARTGDTKGNSNNSVNAANKGGKR
jgi:trimeric autotransporter adhesin